MSAIHVGFIGAGRVARILLGGWKKARAMPSRVALFDLDPGACERLQSLGPRIETVNDPAKAAAQDVVFLAVHPPAIKDALAGVKASLRADATLVSLAPKFTIAKLSEMLGGFARIARMIPNAPSIVGQGYNPVAFGLALKPADRGAFMKLVAPLGACPEVPESQLEIHAIVAAMGPTYLWPQLYELKALAESWGLSAEQSLDAIEAMLRGAAATMKQSGLTQEQVMDLIPVRPLADEVAAIVAAYRAKLQALYDKLRP
jgi:pyrroline-5-carboxylate reductase